jgi:hypothetical protein
MGRRTSSDNAPNSLPAAVAARLGGDSMNHIYALGFATIFITGGISADHRVVPRKMQDRLPETVYADPLAKHSDRLEMQCNG